jgi:Ni,Fe-hydrogenase maturation factor
MGVDGKASVSLSELKLNKKKFRINDSLEFSLHIKSTSKSSQKIIVDYAIDFMKANGKKGRKVFKLKSFELKKGEEVTLTKKHSLKPITTMKYYPGEHHLYIQINGHIVKEASWNLQV